MIKVIQISSVTEIGQWERYYITFYKDKIHFWTEPDFFELLKNPFRRFHIRRGQYVSFFSDSDIENIYCKFLYKEAKEQSFLWSTPSLTYENAKGYYSIFNTLWALLENKK